MRSRFLSILPGLALCAAVTLAALALQWGETQLFGRAWLEALVLAILLGTLVRALWPMPARFAAGIGFSAKILLEIAVVLLGASVSIEAVAGAGPLFILAIAALVIVSIGCSYGVGRLLGLGDRMALLVACGNSICGNSAIAAAAPVIGADGDDVASSIAFTAVLGVLAVLILPILGRDIGLSTAQYGIFAGLTVYAVPQVIAATAPVAALSVQIGTLVKLVRVLMLGPVVLTLGLARGRGQGHRPPLAHLVPWFIVGFLLMMLLRSANLIPAGATPALEAATGGLTVISMAGLGLSVDLRTVAHAGGRVIAAATLSLLMLGGLSLLLIHLLAA
jgi:uncharacterized integral membrane protein (TIGR00698 family)